MSPIDEMKIREGVELVVFKGVLPYKAAKRVQIKHLELDYWLKLYDLHGDAIFEEGAEQRFELELFKLKYPQGAPSVSFLQNLRQNIKGKVPALLLCTVATPIILGVITTIVTLLTETAPSEALLTGLGCMTSSLFSFVILFSMIWVMNMGASVAKTKLRDRTYIKERRLVDKQEIAGALQLAVDGDDLQGGLEVVQDAGGLSLSDDEPRAQRDLD